VRLQMPNSAYSLSNLSNVVRLLDGSFNGLTLSLLSNIPGGAIFFAVKDATKSSLRNSAFSASPKWVTTSLAVAAALIPYWLVRNPSEVIKVRKQAGIEGYGEGVSALEAVQKTLQESNGTTLEGIGEFYSGYWENIIYGFPADVIKFVTYEAITGGRKDLSPLEGAKAGALATSLAQVVTTPLDVVRNRLMTGRDKDGVVLSDEAKRRGYFESLRTLAEEEGLSGLFAGTSPRVAKAFLSGAIQFATYEETKQSISRLLQR
jgi:solute carrier family 25 S-adenosylmethionine transporter 26